MDKVKILVVEDELIIAANICDILEDLNYDVLDPVITYAQALESIKEEEPDLVLIDIQLVGQRDGIDLAWAIRDNYNIPFIFLTSNADPNTIERAKKVNPPAYLLKPFQKNDLYTSIEIALYNYSKNKQVDTVSKEKPQKEEIQENIILKDAIFIKHRDAFVKVKFTDILFLKSERVYIKIYVNTGKEFLVRSSLSSFIEQLPHYFLKIQRSYIVNLDQIDSIGFINLKIQEHEIPFGKGYRAELLEKIKVIKTKS